MEKLTFKKEVEFEKGKTYSVCLRGARRYSTSDEFHLSLYTPAHWENPKEIANIVSQQQFKFEDLKPEDFHDNYDPTARNHDGLLAAMDNVYGFFSHREIVTILRFEIQ